MTSDDFTSTTSALSFGPEADLWRADWPRSQATRPSTTPEFLTRAYVGSTCAWAKLAPELTEQAVGAVELFTRHPAAVRLAWHCHEALFTWQNVDYTTVKAWPLLAASLGPGTEMFYFLVMLSGVPHLRQLHATRAIPEAVTIQTLSDLQTQAQNFRRRHGHWGFANKQWLWHHFRGLIYQLGRLQFCPADALGADFHILRHRATGQVVVLAGQGMRFRADGQFDGANGISDAPGAWTASYSAADALIRGQRISPEGRALPQPVTLPADQWDIALQKGDPALGLHIPASGPMDFDACGQSLAQAVDFFPRHYPEQRFSAFICGSWLFDAQLDTLLPANSNIRRFLREMYLLPMPGANDHQTLDIVFGRETVGDPATLPQQTSLQRTLAAHLRAGGRFRGGASLLFIEDLQWGAEVYRRGRAWTP